MEAHADAVIDAFHMSFACASQILEDLTLIDGDDLFCLAHGRFIQSSLLLNDVMRRLAKLLQLRRKRHHDQGRAKEITTVVLNIDDRSNAALNVAAMFAKINQINVTTPIVPIFLSMIFLLAQFYVKGQESLPAQESLDRFNLNQYVIPTFVLDTPGNGQTLWPAGNTFRRLAATRSMGL